MMTKLVDVLTVSAVSLWFLSEFILAGIHVYNRFRVKRKKEG
ncbi:hypothetical protein [Levilactobacillus bambusae]|nr:hypothetical protein [Levilactobacillus bambusae]